MVLTYSRGRFGRLYYLCLVDEEVDEQNADAAATSPYEEDLPRISVVRLSMIAGVHYIPWSPDPHLESVVNPGCC